MGIFNLTAMSGEKPVEEIKQDVVGADDTPVTVTSSKTDQSDEQMITLDGPLSRIYTKALNLAYARESISMMTPEALLVNKATEQAIQHSTYVYAIDTSQMDMAQLIASTEHFKEAVASGKYKSSVLALESDANVSSKMQLLAQMGKSLGAKVCYSRESAIRAVLASRAGG